jgi:hypothetical protein
LGDVDGDERGAGNYDRENAGAHLFSSGATFDEGSFALARSECKQMENRSAVSQRRKRHELARGGIVHFVIEHAGPSLDVP